MGGELDVSGAGFIRLSSMLSEVGTGSLSKGQAVLVSQDEPGESVVLCWFSLLGVEGQSVRCDGFADE